MALVRRHGRKRHRGTGFTCHVCLLRPKSRGEVTIGSADPLAAPVIDPNFFGEADDLETMVAGFKTTRRLMETPALRALQKKEMFTEGVHSDDDIRSLLRARVDTVYHPVGTAKMGVNDPMAVVDPKLKVYGVEGLRVVDASIMPTLIVGIPMRRRHDLREGRRHDRSEMLAVSPHCALGWASDLRAVPRPHLARRWMVARLWRPLPPYFFPVVGQTILAIAIRFLTSSVSYVEFSP